MKTLFAFLLLLAALAIPEMGFAQAGFFIRDDCTVVTRVNNKTYCLNTGIGGTLEQSQLYKVNTVNEWVCMTCPTSGSGDWSARSISNAVDVATAVRIYNSDNGNGWLFYGDSSGNATIASLKPSDWIIKMSAGKTFCVTNSTDTCLFTIDEATGFLTRLLAGTQTTGDMIYFDGTKWVRLAAGTNGHCLKMGASVPGWAAC